MIKGSIKCYKTDNSFKGGKIEVVLKSKYDELQQRIDKAIEYISKAEVIIDFNKDISRGNTIVVDRDKLLSILRGEDNE